MHVYIYIIYNYSIHMYVYTYRVAIKYEAGHEDMPFPNIFKVNQIHRQRLSSAQERYLIRNLVNAFIRLMSYLQLMQVPK